MMIPRFSSVGSASQSTSDPKPSDNLFLILTSYEKDLVSFERILKANPDLINAANDGDFLIHIAAKHCAKAIPILAKYDAKLDQKNRAGLTPLQLAGSKQNEHAIIALLNAGANVAELDNDIAGDYGHIAHFVEADERLEYAQHSMDSYDRAEEIRNGIIKAIEDWKKDKIAASAPLSIGEESISTQVDSLDPSRVDPAPTSTVSRIPSRSIALPLNDNLPPNSQHLEPHSTASDKTPVSSETSIPAEQNTSHLVPLRDLLSSEEAHEQENTLPVAGRKRKHLELSGSSARGSPDIRRAASAPVDETQRSPYKAAFGVDGGAAMIFGLSGSLTLPKDITPSPEKPKPTTALVIAEKGTDTSSTAEKSVDEWKGLLDGIE